MNNSLRYNKNQKYLIYDFETCNVNLAVTNYPWQLSYLIAQGDKILEVKDNYVLWPDLDKKISEGAARVTRFNAYEYKQKAKFNKELLEDFEKYLYNPEFISIGHNTHGFDVFIHNFWRKELGLKTDYSYLNNAIDSNALARMIKLGVKEAKRENWKRDMFRFADYVEKGLKTSIKVLCKEFMLDYDENMAHDAKYDIVKNFEIWNKLKLKIEI